MRMHLPSGRAIHYHGLKWEKYRQKVGDSWKLKEGWRYDDPKSSGRIPTYGGRLAENATQAVARDILAEALIRLHRAGYRVPGHVHDEIIVEGEHPVEDIVKIMCEPPAWADGLPIDGEGFQCERYRKA
jgi:DNA polymerase